MATTITLVTGGGNHNLSLTTGTGAVTYTLSTGARGPAGTGGGSSTWGAITGTLSNQTDLQQALNAKQATLTNYSTISGLTGYPSSFPTTSADINDTTSDGVTNPGNVLITTGTGELTVKTLTLGSTGGGGIAGALRIVGATAYAEIANPDDSNAVLKPGVTSGIIMVGAGNLSELTVPATARANLLLETAPVAVSTTTRTLALTDDYQYLRCTNASGCAITIPQQSSVTWPDGATIMIRRATGAGALSWNNTGITINNDGIASIAVGQVFAIRKVATDSWDFI